MRRCAALRSALHGDVPVDRSDWARILLASEIVFASDLVGSGTEWRTTTGMDDVSTLELLRVIQRKLAKTVQPYYGKTPGSHED